MYELKKKNWKGVYE